jgi:hypothetical protein
MHSLRMTSGRADAPQVQAGMIQSLRGFPWSFDLKGSVSWILEIPHDHHHIAF